MVIKVDEEIYATAEVTVAPVAAPVAQTTAPTAAHGVINKAATTAPVPTIPPAILTINIPNDF